MRTKGAPGPIPGLVATLLLIAVTALWTFWGVAEMYYEGWFGSWTNRLPYLVPGVVCLILTLVAIRWPRAGGWLLILVGVAFTAWWWGRAARLGQLTWRQVLAQGPVSLSLAVIGILFLVEGRRRRILEARGETLELLRARRRWLKTAVALPLLVALGVTLYWAPTLLTRQDDGDRGARRIQGNGVTLTWAPLGPGWNWQQPWGGYPSWDSLARYGVPPVGLGEKPGLQDVHATAQEMATTGLCRYLRADGLSLSDEPQNIWRMPTTDEIVRSLTRHGENAGCVWDGRSERADCRVTPDKETPLWAPDLYPIYYWSADEFSLDEAYYVNYQGRIGHQRKDWGNPRHGYRCVREE